MTPNIIYNGRDIKLKRNYYYYEYKINLSQWVRRVEGGKLLISRAKLGEAQGKMFVVNMFW